jgi:hypothetical protein
MTLPRQSDERIPGTPHFGSHFNGLRRRMLCKTCGVGIGKGAPSSSA